MSTLIVTGRLGKDGELRTPQGGDKVLSFSIADDIGFGDKKKTQWLKCALFGKRAESIAQYLTKGSMVEVVGVPSINSFEGKNGWVSEIQVRVSEIKLHGGGAKRDDGPVMDKGPGATRGMDEDIPFAPEWR